MNDGEFIDELIAYDEAVRSRSRSKPGAKGDDATPSSARLRTAARVVDLLEQLWPRNTDESTTATAITNEGGARTLTEPFDRLGRFEIEREIGRGANGVVYLARDLQLNRDVALKIPRFLRAADGDARTRFLREAEAAAQLDHPFIVAALEVGEYAGEWYIIYAYVPGPTLADWIQDHDKGSDARLAAQLTLCLATGMAHAHERGIIHRDLKPANIVLQPCSPEQAPISGFNYIPRITDFGLAKWSQRKVEETNPGVLVGTPAYMSPEQTQGAGTHLTPAVDIFSLGVVLYELLTGRRPFVAPSEFETLAKIREETPPSPHVVRSVVPADLASICMKCLGKATVDRYASAQDLAEDLRRWIAGQPVQARAKPTERRLQSPRRNWRRRGAYSVVVGLAACVALLDAFDNEPRVPPAKIADGKPTASVADTTPQTSALPNGVQTLMTHRLRKASGDSVTILLGDDGTLYEVRSAASNENARPVHDRSVKFTVMVESELIDGRTQAYAVDTNGNLYAVDRQLGRPVRQPLHPGGTVKQIWTSRLAGVSRSHPTTAVLVSMITTNGILLHLDADKLNKLPLGQVNDIDRQDKFVSWVATRSPRGLPMTYLLTEKGCCLGISTLDGHASRQQYLAPNVCQAADARVIQSTGVWRPLVSLGIDGNLYHQCFETVNAAAHWAKHPFDENRKFQRLAVSKGPKNLHSAYVLDEKGQYFVLDEHKLEPKIQPMPAGVSFKDMREIQRPDGTIHIYLFGKNGRTYELTNETRDKEPRLLPVDR